jgi:hypothetical protein
MLYNGKKNLKTDELKLSDSFLCLGKDERPGLELIVKAIDIGYNWNNGILKRNADLNGYAYFISQVSNFQGNGIDLEEAIILAADICIKKRILYENTYYGENIMKKTYLPFLTALLAVFLLLNASCSQVINTADANLVTEAEKTPASETSADTPYNESPADANGDSALDSSEEELPSGYGMYNTGLMYMRGEGTEADYEKALYYLRKSGEEYNYPEALNAIGYMYFEGLGIEKNLDTASEYFLRAGGGHNADGWVNLANMHETGGGADQNPELSALYYMLSLRGVSKNDRTVVKEKLLSYSGSQSSVSKIIDLGTLPKDNKLIPSGLLDAARRYFYAYDKGLFAYRYEAGCRIEPNEAGAFEILNVTGIWGRQSQVIEFEGKNYFAYFNINYDGTYSSVTIAAFNAGGIAEAFTIGRKRSGQHTGYIQTCQNPNFSNTCSERVKSIMPRVMESTGYIHGIPEPAVYKMWGNEQDASDNGIAAAHHGFGGYDSVEEAHKSVDINNDGVYEILSRKIWLSSSVNSTNHMQYAVFTENANGEYEEIKNFRDKLGIYDGKRVVMQIFAEEIDGKIYLILLEQQLGGENFNFDVYLMENNRAELMSSHLIYILHDIEIDTATFEIFEYPLRG